MKMPFSNLVSALTSASKWLNRPSVPRLLAWLTWIAGMVIAALVTFPNHYNFRTYGYDAGYVLGMFENISRGNFLGTVYYSGEVPHISYAVYILGLPFYWLGGIWGILAYQWLGIGMGAWGIYVYARQKIGKLAWLSMLHYWGMWGVYSALAYDVHPDILGPCLVPWIFYALETKKRLLLYALTLVALFSKHTISIWLVFIFIFLYLYHKKDDLLRRYSLYMLLTSIIAVIISFLLNAYLEKYFHSLSRFSAMYRYLWSDNPLNPTHYAETTIQKVKYLIKNWYYMWAFLWESSQYDPAYVGIKSETYLSVILCGGWAFGWMPLLLIPIVPIVLYKSLANDYQVWGTLFQYSMEYAVYIPLALAIWLAQVPKNRRALLAVVVALMTHIWNLYLMKNRVSKWYSPEQMLWYKCVHYVSPYRYKEIHEGLAIIPDTSYVMAVSRLLPHLPPRPGRQFHIGYCDQVGEESPVCIDPRTEYITLLRGETNPWPVGVKDYEALIDYLSHSPKWQLIYDKDELLIFRRVISPNGAKLSQSTSGER